jgi:hypothetical protein
VQRVLFIGQHREIIGWLQLGETSDLISAASADAALERLSGGESFDLVVGQLSCLGRRKRLWSLGRPEVDQLPAFLHGLAQRCRPKRVLIIADAAVDTRWNLAEMGRDLNLDVRFLHDATLAAPSESTIRPSFSNLLLGLPFAGTPVADGACQVGLITNTAAESGHHRRYLDVASHGRLEAAVSDAHQRPASSQVKLHEEIIRRGEALLDVLRTQCRDTCPHCHRPSRSPCKLESLLTGRDPAGGTTDDGPLVAITYGHCERTWPIEFLPWHGSGHAPLPLYQAKPVMHQFASQGPPGAFTWRLRDLNVLLICSSPANPEDGPLTYAEDEVAGLQRMLDDDHARRDGRGGKCASYLAREYDSFEHFERSLAGEHPNTRWHIVHWAGHARQQDGQALFQWPRSDGEVDWVTQGAVGSFLESLGPFLIHVSCCRVGGTSAMTEFSRLSSYTLGYRWEIEDRSASQFVRTFYENLWRYRMHPSEALWRARNAYPAWDIGAGAVLVGGTNWIPNN